MPAGQNRWKAAMMQNGWKIVWMHLCTMLALCFLAYIKAPDHLQVGILTGWFGVFIMPRMHSSKPQQIDLRTGLPIATPAPVTVTKVVDR
jgi:hypothetical protein